jgi:DNA repair and recombination protein RAD52
MPQPPSIPQQANLTEPVAFFSAKAINQLPTSSLQGTTSSQLTVPRGNQLFNPKAESPSIPKTPGIDHSSSKPLARSGQHVAPTSSQTSEVKTGGFAPVRPSPNATAASTRGAVLNPSLDQARRIGAPGAPGSPLANRSSYRPPSMKRTLPGEAGGAGPPRSPLHELPANGVTNVDPTTDGLEAKRQKVV